MTPFDRRVPDGRGPASLVPRPEPSSRPHPSDGRGPASLVPRSTDRSCAGDLTPREEQILELLGDCLTNREIGARLGITEKTVKNTVTTVLAKSGVRNRTQAAVLVHERRSARTASLVRPLPFGARRAG
jgi:DNA-binding NarL/FixJ family response regulator